MSIEIRQVEPGDHTASAGKSDNLIMEIK